ncbi:MAG TPA: endonuclease NucS domain-containing protein [Terriglobales bacterium]|nr:endonuclease NucS domain-containing protein [Terriglobales bacterium]
MKKPIHIDDKVDADWPRGKRKGAVAESGMTEADTKNLPLKSAYSFLSAHGLGEESEKIRSSKERLGSLTTTLKRAKVVALLQHNGLLDQFVAAEWPNGGTPQGEQHIKRLEGVHQRYKSTGATEDKEEPEADEGEGGGFIREEHLRDYLADHLELLESGLELWPVGQDTDAVEFPVNGRRIDILARDSRGIPVVIELKVSRGHERTIGQCLYYRGRIRELLNQETVRVFIVALEISKELRLATRELEDIVLFEYTLSMNVTRL